MVGLELVCPTQARDGAATEMYAGLSGWRDFRRPEVDAFGPGFDFPLSSILPFIPLGAGALSLSFVGGCSVCVTSPDVLLGLSSSGCSAPWEPYVNIKSMLGVLLCCLMNSKGSRPSCQHTWVHSGLPHMGKSL